MDEEALGQQRMMMLNMDPPMHTRYRRLVNKGFTPRMIRDLEEKVVAAADSIIDSVCETGSADFVEQISAELPLQVIADLMGVPQEDRHLVFDWSNKMIGSDDPEYQLSPDAPAQASMELFAYADELCAKKRLDPHQDLFSVLTQAEIDGDQLTQLELELFFLLLAVAGNETTRNLISGAMVAFFDHPDQWERLRADRSLLPIGRRGDAALRLPGHALPPAGHRRRDHRRPEDRRRGQGGLLAHLGQPGRERSSTDPEPFDIGRTPNNHMAFGGGGPHFCLGANLARMEIRVMFERLLDRLPDIRLDGKVQRLRSNFINGVKHIPVAFTPRPRSALSRPSSRRRLEKADAHAFPPGSHLPARRRDHPAVDRVRHDGLLGRSTSRTTCSTRATSSRATPTRRPRTAPRSGRRRPSGPIRCASSRRCRRSPPT